MLTSYSLALDKASDQERIYASTKFWVENNSSYWRQWSKVPLTYNRFLLVVTTVFNQLYPSNWTKLFLSKGQKNDRPTKKIIWDTGNICLGVTILSYLKILYSGTGVHTHTHSYHQQAHCYSVATQFTTSGGKGENSIMNIRMSALCQQPVCDKVQNGVFG